MVALPKWKRQGSSVATRQRDSFPSLRLLLFFSLTQLTPISAAAIAVVHAEVAAATATAATIISRCSDDSKAIFQERKQ